ncbi:trypsin-like serine protease [Streptomyces luteireticuli]|uniref:S1 family peptidase n=1 Tax=Streptomyces luteireticuli TaxID=173858 RepID=UPI003557FD6C
MPRLSRPVTAVAAAAAALVLAGPPAQAMTGGRQLPAPGAAPWLATLAVKGDGPLLPRASCGGALVGEDTVLTAAHCLDGVDPARLEVHIGSSVLSRDPGVVRDLARTRLHPEYRLLPSPVDPGAPELSSAQYDIAVIRLAAPVRGVRPLALARHRPAPGADAAMFSHGTVAAPDPSRPDVEIRGDVLRRGDLTAVPHGECAAGTPATVDRASTFCAGDRRGGGTTMCTGDSGSPLVVRQGRRPELVGIASFGGETAGKRCGQPADAAFADVAAVREWVARAS